MWVPRTLRGWEVSGHCKGREYLLESSVFFREHLTFSRACQYLCLFFCLSVTHSVSLSLSPPTSPSFLSALSPPLLQGRSPGARVSNKTPEAAWMLQLWPTRPLPAC